jgi:hypothetical protein
MQCVVQAIRETIPLDQPCEMPAPRFLARNANRQRQGTRPRHPTDLQFEVQEYAIPDDFLRYDVEVNNRRHLMFATTAQLQLLDQAYNWFMDGTFKVSNSLQLFTSNVEDMAKSKIIYYAYNTADTKLCLDNGVQLYHC